jgi:cell division transport system permease protein
VRLKPDAGAGPAEGLIKKLKGMRGVEDVQYLQEEAGKLRSLINSFRLAGLILGFGVLLGVVFISYSTLRLAVLAHSDEVQVMKLMGATRPFIMAPFLFEGAIQGVIAASMSLGLLYGLLRVFSRSSAMMLLAPSGLAFLPFWAWSGIVLAGGVLGLMGSFFAFSRTLRM